MSLTLIYALRDPRDGCLRYVGRTVDPAHRLRSHCWPNLSEQFTLPPKVRWIYDLRADGLEPEMMPLEWVNDEDARAAERHWIEIVNRRHRLTNARHW